MADIVITAANVIGGAGSQIETGFFGATVKAGETVVLDPADNKWKLADCNSPTAALRATRGFALNGGSSGQPAVVHRKGRIVIGGAVTVGQIYVQSATPGGIAPASDLATGDYVTTLGIGVSATEIDVQIHNSGVAVPA